MKLVIWFGYKYELSQRYEKISIFSHSLSGCLLFGPSQNHKFLSGQLFLSGVLINFNKSMNYLEKRKSLTITDFNVKNNQDFISNFKQILPLYFQDTSYSESFWIVDQWT